MNTNDANMLIRRIKKENGFTILELLVVLAIIGLLASVVLVRTGEFRERGRDAAREEDMKQLQNALDIYHVSNLRYPICSKDVLDGTSDCLAAALIADGSARGTPTDPLGGSAGVPADCGVSSSVYVFCYESTDGTSYTLEYQLETDTISGKSSGWQSVSP